MEDKKNDVIQNTADSKSVDKSNKVKRIIALILVILAIGCAVLGLMFMFGGTKVFGGNESRVAYADSVPDADIASGINRYPHHIDIGDVVSSLEFNLSFDSSVFNENCSFLIIEGAISLTFNNTLFPCPVVFVNLPSGLTIIWSEKTFSDTFVLGKHFLISSVGFQMNSLDLKTLFPEATRRVTSLSSYILDQFISFAAFESSSYIPIKSGDNFCNWNFSFNTSLTPELSVYPYDSDGLFNAIPVMSSDGLYDTALLFVKLPTVTNGYIIFVGVNAVYSTVSGTYDTVFGAVSVTTGWAYSSYDVICLDVNNGIIEDTFPYMFQTYWGQYISRNHVFFPYDSSSDKAYNAGFQAGHESGYQTGHDDGEKFGYDAGYKDGYQNTEESYNIGYNQGKIDGYDEGIQSGFNQGYENGYNSALNDKDYIIDGIFGVVDAPFSVIRNALNFEIFGINVSGVAFFLISCLLIAFVIKKLV